MSAQTSEPVRFGDVLDAVGSLSPEEQYTLVDIISHRLAEQGRSHVLANVQEARREFAAGLCRPVTAEELWDEINS